MRSKKLFLGCFVIFFSALIFCMPFVAHTEAAYPEKPITMIVVNSAGGGVDGLNRAIASRLEKILGVPMVVKNETGSGGRKGSISLFKSTPDGYTIGMPHFAAFLYDKVLAGRKLPIDYEKFEVLMRADTTEFFILVNKNSPYKSIQDFKMAGKPIKFAGSGVGNPSWLQPTALASVVGFKISFVTGHKNLREGALASLTFVECSMTFARLSIFPVENPTTCQKSRILLRQAIRSWPTSVYPGFLRLLQALPKTN